MKIRFNSYSRYGGKSEMTFIAAEIAVNAGKSVIFATTDQQGMIDRLLARFPGALAEVVGDWGVKVHPMRGR